MARKPAKPVHKAIVMDLGEQWGELIQRVLTKEALEQARAQLGSGKAATGDYVEVKLPVSIHLAFRKRGRGVSRESGIARCFCIFKQDPDGSSTCTCRGPDAAVCDCELVVV